MGRYSEVPEIINLIYLIDVLVKKTASPFSVCERGSRLFCFYTDLF